MNQLDFVDGIRLFLINLCFSLQQKNGELAIHVCLDSLRMPNVNPLTHDHPI